MSRSKRVPILKDKPRNYKRTSAYWRPVRRVCKYFIRNINEVYDERSGYNWNELDIPNPKTIVNDWDYSDYYWDYRIDCITDNEDINTMWKENRIKYSRK